MLFDLKTLTKVDRSITRSTIKSIDTFHEDFLDVLKRSENNRKLILDFKKKLKNKVSVVGKNITIEDNSEELEKALSMIDYFNEQLKLYYYISEVLNESRFNKNTKQNK
ncbi:MAG: hypothetical protein ACRCX8_20735 [Sarcina sp.]